MNDATIQTPRRLEVVQFGSSFALSQGSVTKQHPFLS